MAFAVVPSSVLCAMVALSLCAAAEQSVEKTPAKPAPAAQPSNPATAPAPAAPAKPSGPGPLIAATGVLDRAKKVGDAAPAFTLADAQGGEFSLENALKKGPVVLTWFRGEWCPYCNKQLVALQDRLAEFDALGATVVAISPQNMEHSESMLEKDGVKFHMLSDSEFKVGEKYGVRYELPPAMKEQLKKYKLDLSKFNGGEGDALPLTATYVIDQAGVIRYAFLDADYTKRASPEDLLAEVRRLKK